MAAGLGGRSAKATMAGAPVAALISAAALLVTTGLAVAASRKPSLIPFAIAIPVGIGISRALRHTRTLRRPGDQLIAAIIVFPPLLPWISTYVGAATDARFLLAIALLALMAQGSVPTRRQAVDGLGALIILFCAWQVCTLAISAPTMYSLLRFLNWVMFVPLAFIAYDRHSRRVAAGALGVAFGLLVAGVGLQLARVLGGIWGGSIIGGAGALYTSSVTYTYRYTSFLLNPNDLGLFLLASAVALWLLSLDPRLPARPRLLLLGCAGVGMVLLPLTISRGALIAIPFVLLFTGIAGRPRPVLAALAVLAVVVLVLPPFVPQVRTTVTALKTSVESVLVGSDASAQARRQLWHQRLGETTGGVAGAGYGGYVPGVDLSTTNARQLKLLRGRLTTDNGWLKLWLESGIVGTSLFALLLLAALRRSVRAGRSRSHDGLLAVAAGGTLVVFAVRGASADVFDINPWNCLIWLLIGIAAQPVGAHETTHDPDAARRAGPRALLTAD